MNTSLLTTINQLFITLDQKYGADALGADTLIALIETLDEYTGDTSSESLQQGLCEIYTTVLSCKPRMASIILDLQLLLVDTLKNPEFTAQNLRHRLLELLARKRTRRQESVQHALTIISGSEKVLLHSYSSTINTLLKTLNKQGSKPEILLAAQERAKTDRMIQLLEKLGYAYRVVSEYAIAHILQDVDCALFGGLSLTNKMEVVMGPGSASLLSQLHAHQIKSYVLLTTNKFSLWDDSYEITFHEKREKEAHGVQYLHETFSHDVLSLSLIKGLITENGVLTQEESLAAFSALKKEFAEREKAIASLQMLA